MPFPPVDLFHFTMQQLAPNPLRFGEGDPHTVRAYLHHWLHRHHYPHEPHRLQTGAYPLKLDALGWGKLLADTAEFYGVLLPSHGPAGLSTLEDVEAYLQQLLLKAAA